MRQYSFWSLLDEKTFCIPRIQRDYAQGREEPRIQSIRSGFIGDMHQALTGRRGALDLGLFFGSSSQDGQLVLIDGQQRATTLWLLHWYLCVRGAGDSVAVGGRLKKFSYETRASARDFCKQLTTHGMTLVIGEGDLDHLISDQMWFRSSWSEDPTISGMLRMLRELHTKFSEENAQECWCSLTEPGDCLYFHFVDIQQYHLNDELYVKMNARGRPLTDFERFKAWLEGHIDSNPENYQSLVGNWSRKIDTIWLDTLWKELNRSSILDGFDNASEYLSALIFRLFKFVALNHALAQERFGKDEAEQLIAKIRKDEFLSPEDLGALFDQESLALVFRVLEQFTHQGKRPSDWMSVWEGEINFFYVKKTEESCPHPLNQLLFDATYVQGVHFYALCCYMSRPDASPNEPKWSQWMRLVRNLSTNITVSAENYGPVIRRIDALFAGGIEGIHDRVIAFEDPRRVFGKQLAEERCKSEQILENPAYGSLFLELENHEFFHARIGFLCQLFWGDQQIVGAPAGIDAFREYADKCRVLFGGDPLEEPFLLQRALLIGGDYLFETNTCHYSFGQRPDEWHEHMLTMNYVRHDRFLPALCELVKYMPSGVEMATAVLEEYIEERKETVTDWRTPFIRYSSCLRGCGLRRIYCYFQDDQVVRVMLLNGNTRSSYQKEVYTHTLYTHYLKGSEIDGLFSITYWWDRGSSSFPCIALKPSGEVDASYCIRIDYKETERSGFGFVVSFIEDPKPAPEIEACLQEFESGKELTFPLMADGCIPEQELSSVLEALGEKLQSITRVEQPSSST